MNNKWIERVQDFLVMAMNHLILTVLAICIIGLFKDSSPNLLLWTAMFVFPAGYYFVRGRVKKLIPFLLIHVLTPISVLLVPVGWLLRAVMAVMAITYSIVSAKIRYREEPADDAFLPPLGVGIFMGVVTLVENLYSKRGWEQYYLIIAILYFGLYFIEYFLGQYLFFRTVNKSSTGVIPEKAIFTAGAKQTLLFSVGSMVILLLAANFGWVSYIWSWIWKVIDLIMRFLVSLLPQGEDTESSMGTEAPGEGDSGMPDFGDEQTNEFLRILWEIIDKLLIAAVIVGTAVLIVWVTNRIVKFLRSRFYRSRETSVIELEGGVDIRESCDIEREDRATSAWFGFLNPREKIRRIFKKQVWKNKEKIVGMRSPDMLGYLTAKECTEKISEEQAAPEELTKLYEQARYGREDVGNEEVKRAKAAAKK